MAHTTTNEADYVFITFILDQLPHGLIGLLVAAFFAAAMSSKAAELNALGSTTTVDFYRHLRKRPATDAHYVLASKGFTVLWGFVALSFALFANLAENLIQAINILGSVFYGVVLGLFLVGFILKRVGGTAIFWAALGAQIAVFVLYFSLNDRISYLWYNFNRHAARLYAARVTVLFQVAIRLLGTRESRNAIRLPLPCDDAGSPGDMSHAPVICFGQQPCGIFSEVFPCRQSSKPARRLQAQLGGEIVFFYHDSDHDPRQETKTLLRHRKSNEPIELNFTFDNKLQRKFSPLHLKRVRADWLAKTKFQLPAYVDRCWVDAFKKIAATNIADFCLEMYQQMGLLDGIRVVRSSDPAFRTAACDIDDFFVDLPYAGEIVRAPPHAAGTLQLHEGGDHFITHPATPFTKEQISPSRDTRLRWMQSVLHCTHYVAGASEQDYMRKEDAPEITYVNRDTIERPNEAYTEIPA